MCLAIPAKIHQIDGEIAKAAIGGSEIEANISFVEEVDIGDYILIHAGFALEKVDEEEARETLNMLAEMEELNRGSEDQSNGGNE